MENLIGQTFNRLTVLGFSHDKNRHNFWLCLCACGNKVVVEQSKLKSGHTKSCGCLRKNDLEELIGHKFGLLCVIEEAPTKKVGDKFRRYIRCECACGNIVDVRMDQLLDGNTKSCGCLVKDRSVLPLPDYTNEVALKKAKSIFKNIKQRCYNSNNTRFKHYGGRGIIICNSWLESFDNFLKDMGIPPSHKHQLDRINNDGNYCPENCRWVTNQENNRNKQSDFDVTYKGETKQLREWVEELDLDFSTVKKRLLCGWDVEKSFTLPVGEF